MTPKYFSGSLNHAVVSSAPYDLSKFIRLKRCVKVSV